MKGYDVDLSIIIPTYDRDQILPLVIEAWRTRVPRNVRAEIIVIDDGSPGSTAAALEVVATRSPDCRVPLRVLRQANAGRAAARNRGISEARGRILLFSDDDMVPRSPDFVERHLAAQGSRPGAWVSRLVVPDSVVTTRFQAYWRRRLHAGTEKLASSKDLGKGGFWFATLSIPRELLGPERFAEAFNEYGWEEHEMGLRLFRRGLRARFLREAEVEHHDAVEFDTTVQKYRQMGRSAWVFHYLQPTLEVSLWTGTHPLSRWLRRLIRQKARAAHLLMLDSESLSDAQYRLCLEGAYALGLEEGSKQRETGITLQAVRTQKGSRQ